MEDPTPQTCAGYTNIVRGGPAVVSLSMTFKSDSGSLARADRSFCQEEDPECVTVNVAQQMFTPRSLTFHRQQKKKTMQHRF